MHSVRTALCCSVNLHTSTAVAGSHSAVASEGEDGVAVPVRNTSVAISSKQEKEEMRWLKNGMIPKNEVVDPFLRLRVSSDRVAVTR